MPQKICTRISKFLYKYLYIILIISKMKNMNILNIGFIIIITLLRSHNTLIEEKNEDIEQENTIYLNSKINEVFATTEVTQYFTNILEEPIELLISFPIKEEITLSKFILTVGDKTITSKVLKKEEAEEKYDNCIYSGNTGFISKYEKDMKNYVINIGNINPKVKVKLQAFFIQNIGSADMSYEFVIMEKYPTFHYKEINQNEARNKIIKANFKIETQSKITRLSAPFFDDEAKKNSKYEVKFSKDYKSANIIYVKNPYEQKNFNIENNEEKLGYPGKVNEPTRLTSFSILFRVENMNKPKMYYQYNKELNEISYVINHVYSSKILENIPIPEYPDQDNKISYYEKYQSYIINDSPGLFIFLVDQSGSMSGKSIELVRQALIISIKSLPPKLYFQLIGFGIHFRKYNEIPVINNEKNVNDIINIIKEMEADMGGTNIVDPLRSIYNDNSYDKINLSKNIFMLTDGQINDRDECIKLISENSNKFRIHAFGIGNYFDKVLIERCGKLGKGSSVFVENVDEIIHSIMNELNIGLRNYLIDIKHNFLDYQENIKNAVIISKPINNFAYQDEIINFSFILDNKNKINIDKLSTPIKIEITGKNSKGVINEVILFKKNENIIKLPDGDDLFKIIVGQGLKNNFEFIKDKNKEIEFSQKYQILSKNTALYAEIINHNDFKQKKLITVDLDNYSADEDEEEVYYGTTFQGYSGETKDLILFDVTLLSLGIETVGGVMTTIIPQDTVIPCKKSQIFTTYQDNQTTFTIHILEGERPLTKDNHSIAKFDLNGIPPAPRGQTQIEVTFDIDENDILTVSAVEKTTGKSEKIVINHRLSKEESYKMIREALESKEQDKITRARMDAKNSLENYIYSMKNKIEDKEKVIGVKLTEDEKKTIGNALKEAQDWINAIQEAENEEYETHLKDLQKICDPIIGKI